MATDSPENIIKDLKTQMIPPTGGLPFIKQSHFLNPTFTPSPSTPSPFKPFIQLPPKPLFPHLRVSFNGWRRTPNQTWVSWVRYMEPKYGSIWRKIGIWDGIVGSTVRVLRDEEVVMGLVERWCPETNTFVFPWGEATVTLEDVVVLGGFPVLGDNVGGEGEDRDSVEVRRRLVEVHRMISRGKSQKASYNLWMRHFMGGGEEIGVEHEAFLALWLSVFVFPAFPDKVVSKRFFRFAVCLARGCQVAMGPIVLASIYRDLTLLKSTMDAAVVMMEEESEGGGEENSVLAITLWAPLHLVQVWAWERFVELRPKPVVLEPAQPRLARWHLLEKKDMGNVRPILQSAGDTFQWRPYAIAGVNLALPGFYRETEEYVLVDEDLDVEVKAFARCLRVSELGGIDCIEMYRPHRVAMQFGFDQDIPDHVPKLDVTLEFAWLNYTRPIKDEVIYIPSRHVEADVTSRYLKWQRESVVARQVAFEGIPRKIRCLKRVKRLKRVKKEDENASCLLDAPPGFNKKYYNKPSSHEDPWKNDENFEAGVVKMIQENGANGLRSRTQNPSSVSIKKEKEDAAYGLGPPPGFQKKYNKLAKEDLGNNSENRHGEMSDRTQWHHNRNRKGEEDSGIGPRSRAHSLSSSTADNETNLWLNLTPTPLSKGKAATRMGYGEVGRTSERNIPLSVLRDAEIVGNIAGSSVGCSVLKSLVDRISKLEETVSLLNAAK